MTVGLPIIYLVDASVAITGAFVSSCNIAQAFAGRARVVLVLSKYATISPEDLRDFWRVEYVPMGMLSRNITALLRYVPLLCVGAWGLRRAMARDGAQYLVLNDFYLMYGAMLRLLGFRGRIVQWVRCEPKRFAGPLARPMLALAHLSASKLVAVSSFVRRLLPAYYQTTLVYDCVSTKTRRARNWHASDEKIFVYIGNYIRGKGQDVALAAFVEAAKQDATIRLHFYGGDMGLPKNRAFRRELEAVARNSTMHDRIVFHDAIHHPMEVLETAYAALNFSQSESFSMTVLEASGAGVPVIATTSGGPQEIILDGVTGYLIPVGDVAAASEKILGLANAWTEINAMGIAAAQHVQRQFSPEQFRAQIADLLFDTNTR